MTLADRIFVFNKQLGKMQIFVTQSFLYQFFKLCTLAIEFFFAKQKNY